MRQLLLYAALAGTLAAAACTSRAPQAGGQQVVLAVQTGVTDGYTTNRLEVNDEGLPMLHNLTGYPVRLVSVQWVDKPAAVHILNIYAYTYGAVGHGIITGERNLTIDAPHHYHARSARTPRPPAHS